MSDSIYAFRRGPTYNGATRQDLLDSVMAQPMGRFATLVDQTVGGALGTLGLGNTARLAQLPEEAPTVPGLIVTGEGGNTTWVPDSPNMRRMRTIWGNPSNIQAETPEQFQARRDAAGALDEAAYRSSPYFRTDIPWDTGMTEDRAAALAAMYDAKKVREYYATKRPIIAFMGNLAGQFADPINYIPILGPLVKAAAVARLGKIGGTVLFSALDSAANTAIFSVATSGIRQKFGDDVSWQATVSQIATDALIGGVLGGISEGIGGAANWAFARRGDAKLRLQVEQRLSTLRNTQEARIALNEAIDGVSRGEDIRLSPNSTEPLARIASEVERLSRAYDGGLDRPTGPVEDALARIEPGDMNAVIAARGAFRKINELEVPRSGTEPVKVIWAHGKKSAKGKALRVTKADLVALPDIVREFEPVPSATVVAVGDAPMRTWRVKRNGRVLVYADKGLEGGQRLVSVHVEKGGPNAPKLSERKKQALPQSRQQALGLVADSAGDSSIGAPGAGTSGVGTPGNGTSGVGSPAVDSPGVGTPAVAQAATGSSADLFNSTPDDAPQTFPSPTGAQSPAAADKMARRPNIDNSVAPPEPRPAGIDQAEAAVARVENPVALAEQYGVDPNTGAFAEEAEIAQLAAEGRLSQSDAAAFADAQKDFDAGSAFAEALKSVARFLT